MRTQTFTNRLNQEEKWQVIGAIKKIMSIDNTISDEALMYKLQSEFTGLEFSKLKVALLRVKAGFSRHQGKRGKYHVKNRLTIESNGSNLSSLYEVEKEMASLTSKLQKMRISFEDSVRTMVGK